MTQFQYIGETRRDGIFLHCISNEEKELCFYTFNEAFREKQKRNQKRDSFRKED